MQGRNLLDKEFRYLRTVIFTAAVYYYFYFKLYTKNITFTAPGRCQTLYIIFTILQSPVFLLNSRHPLICYTQLKTLNLIKHSFSRSYRVILPSSFNIILSNVLVYYTSSPVSVLVRFLTCVISRNNLNI